MPHLPPMPYRVVIKKLRKLGFAFRRATGGSHEVWWSEEKRKTCIVPHHKEVKSGTLKSIITQGGITEKEFLNV
ncbi:type II toxin-antitoxin system HicA family toxin [Candidatus Roizmanbacteria bacterium]|nr:type II toxin-antitoxin system HicA family toxin [Candidatus Roizmanbacteria bacterium]